MDGGTNQEDQRLEFSEAMRDFRTMFPRMDNSVIEAVLRANNGAVDDTIDQLLVMSMEDREEHAQDETLPKRIGDLETATPRVNVPPAAQSPSSAIASASSSSTTAASSAQASLPSYSLVDVDEGKSSAKSNDQQAGGGGSSRQDKSIGRRKIYRPPMVGRLPADFLRISIGADPWDKRSTPSYSSGRRSTQSFDLDEHEGPPPPYSVAVGRRYSERSATTGGMGSDRSHYRSPQHQHQHHTYLGVFRTTSTSHHQPPSPRRSSNLTTDHPSSEQTLRRRSSDDPELAQYLEDERIALMLQNEEFMRQLRNDRDFMAALEVDAAEARRRQSPRHSSSISHNNQLPKSQREPYARSLSTQSAVAPPPSTDGDPTGMGPGLLEPFPADPFPYTKTLPKDDAIERSFQDKLSLMGRASKRKFATMARRFIGKTKGAKGVLDNKESRTHTLLLNSDEESGGEDNTVKPSAAVGTPEGAAGYNQPSDSDYNIGRNTDLKQGRFF